MSSITLSLPKAPRRSFSLIVQWGIATIGSLFLIYASLTHLLPLSIYEVIGFITGAASVWLVAKNNIWNWPMGILNAGFYVYVFATAHLYGDSFLQIFFLVTSVLGWYWWLKGGENKTELPIGNVTMKHLLAVVTPLTIGAFALTYWILTKTNDVAPFLDSLTLVLSFSATYLMAKRLIENWYVWITIDIFSIFLYFSKGLPLTSVLYVIYLAMCLVGLYVWIKERKATEKT